MLKITSEGQQRAEQIDVPLSFQSAMAGIMLALEIVLEAKGLSRKEIKSVSQWQVLERVTNDNPFQLQYLKNSSNLCLCGDSVYQSAYKLKWNNS
jgi:hypothetical protein